MKHAFRVEGFALLIGTGNMKTGEMASATLNMGKLVCVCGWAGPYRQLCVTEDPRENKEILHDGRKHLGLVRWTFMKIQGRLKKDEHTTTYNAR